MTDYPNGMMKAFAASAAAATEAAARINGEMMDFGRKRLETDASIAEAMLGVKSLQDLLALQREFMVQTLESYTEETGKLGTMAFDMTTNVVTRLGKAA